MRAQMETGTESWSVSSVWWEAVINSIMGANVTYYARVKLSEESILGDD